MRHNYKTMRDRNTIEQAIRDYMASQDFTEVRTGILNGYPELATMKQFTTKSPLTDLEQYLRIAPEEELKKLLAHGYDKVYEMATNFRADANDDTHLPEFTSLEAYDKGTDVFDEIRLTEGIVKNAILSSEKKGILPPCQFNASATKMWPIIKIHEHIEENKGKLKRFNLDRYYRLSAFDEPADFSEIGKCAEELSDIIADISYAYDTPIFIGESPWFIEGPSIPIEKDDHVFKERYEMYYKGLEMANIYSNLLQPDMYKKWYDYFISQKRKWDGSDIDYDKEMLHYIDNRKIPKSAGLAIGLDRLIAKMLNKQSIQNVVCTNNYKEENHEIN